MNDENTIIETDEILILSDDIPVVDNDTFYIIESLDRQTDVLNQLSTKLDQLSVLNTIMYLIIVLLVFTILGKR